MEACDSDDDEFDNAKVVADIKHSTQTNQEHLDKAVNREIVEAARDYRGQIPELSDCFDAWITDVTVGDDAGEARVFAGETLSDDTTITDATPITADETSYRTLGRHVAIAGDLNHDGYNDLAVSGIESTTGHPTTFVLPGGIGIFPSINPVPIDAIAIATMTPAGATQLVELVPTGDLTGDGVDDLAILTTAPDGDFAAVYPGTTDGFGSDPRFIPLSLSNDAALASGGVARMRPLDEPLLVLATSSGDLSIYLLPGF